MSRPRAALQDLMTAVDAGHHVVVADGDTDKLLAPRQRSSYGARGRKSAPAPAPVVVETSSDASFEFSAVASYGAASPASMVFSDGQLRAHQFPAVRSSAGSSQAASPARGASAGGSGSSRSAARAAGTSMGSKKRVSFATDGAGKAAKAGGGGQGKKRGGGGGGGLLGCMASACRSSRNEVVDPARHSNRKMVAA